MSRSRRKTKIFGNTTARSERSDKTFAHRRLRRRVAVTLRESLRTCEEPNVFPLEEEVFDPWLAAKDGKTYWKDAPEKEMRK